MWGSTNEDYGSSGLTSADLNRDGRPDLVYTNGDGFGPAATPGPRPWHGVQWFENKGDGNFRFHRIGNYQGAYSPIVADIDGETLVGKLDRAGFAVASGAACSSANPEPSHVLQAMGVAPDLARGAVRVSLGAGNGEADIDDFINALQATIGRLQGLTAVAV